ncbi:MAG: hypothetical protein DI527_00625 [Chelatococcus sp.]|nr:MAG: hypothetical protein DI527_00625 [Chelatococcus sp.]
MRGIFLGETRIGSVTKFVGNRPAERWVAYSIHKPAGAAPHDHGERRGFPTQRAAMAWLQELHEQRTMQGTG